MSFRADGLPLRADSTVSRSQRSIPSAKAHGAAGSRIASAQLPVRKPAQAARPSPFGWTNTVSCASVFQSSGMPAVRRSETGPKGQPRPSIAPGPQLLFMGSRLRPWLSGESSPTSWSSFQFSSSPFRVYIPAILLPCAKGSCEMATNPCSRGGYGFHRDSSDWRRFGDGIHQVFFTSCIISSFRKQARVLLLLIESTLLLV